MKFYGTVFILAVVLLGAVGTTAYQHYRKPTTTADQRESIRNVQLNFTSSRETLNNSKEYIACLAAPVCKDMLSSQALGNYIDAQTKLQNSVQAVFSEAKADPAKWQLDPALHFVEIPKPVLNPAGGKPAPGTPASATTHGDNSPANTGNGNTVTVTPAAPEKK